ncbi:MAG: helix-turn-helix transcriptional regulator [Clostridia bacterium]|nr:helix-turn-helix transcriptional regulator [Clostridia bacterium]
MNRIKDLREDRDLRQIDVAMATGMDQKTLSNYETGKTNPDSFAIIKLADFFNVSCDYLLGRTPPQTDIENSLRKIEEEITQIRHNIKK